VSTTRVPFDTTLPFVVACQELACGPQKLVRGEPFAWRELGLTEMDLGQLWVAGQVDCVVVDPTEAQARPSRRPAPRGSSWASAPTASQRGS
jgi:hypothetical protein